MAYFFTVGVPDLIEVRARNRRSLNRAFTQGGGRKAAKALHRLMVINCFPAAP